MSVYEIFAIHFSEKLGTTVIHLKKNNTYIPLFFSITYFENFI